MIGNPFKQRGHYVYDYKPRYYDARKERLDNMIKRYEQGESDGETPKITLSKDQLRNEWSRHKKSGSDRKTTLRLALIIAILVGIAAYIFELHKLI